MAARTGLGRADARAAPARWLPACVMATVTGVIETAAATEARPAAGGWEGLPATIERHRVRAAAVVAILVGLPLIVAVAVLRSRPWHPVLDLAMTEFRVRDVFTRHTPLIGLPGRIGEYPDQGSHPGPLSFYLLAPTYRLLGVVAVGDGGRHGGHPPRRHRHGALAGLPSARLGRPGGRRRPVRRAPPRLRPDRADPTVEPVPPARGLDARAAVGVGGRRRRHGRPRPARRRGVLLRPDPRAVPAARDRHGRARPRRRARPVPHDGPGREAGRPSLGPHRCRCRRRAVAAAVRRPGPSRSRQHPPAARPLRLPSRGGDRGG